MKLLSVNVSLPIDIDYNGKIIKTGIFKSPVEGDVYVSKLNVSGDRQADLKCHGGKDKAVYAFSVNEYQYWKNVLNIETMEYGAFGENLSILELSESNLCIGDHLRIGSCLFEITQPRVPCYKLAARFNNKTVPDLFIKKAATGIYLRVLEEGFIKKNDDVIVVREEKNRLSVQSIFKAVFEKKFSNKRYFFEKAMDIPELASEWRNLISKRLEMLD